MNQTKLVAILNITPNSFSDGGLYIEPEDARNQLELLIKSKPYVIDIGAISTRPNSVQPSVSEEIDRYKNVIQAIAPILRNSNVKISIDSYNYETIEYLHQHIPIHWINDEKGFIDERITNFAINNNTKLVIMHHLTIPSDPLVFIDESLDPMDEVINWLTSKAAFLESRNVPKGNIIMDPGIGFGKTLNQNWQIISNAEKFTKLGYEVLFGHSRKSFLNSICEKDFKDRDFETSIVSSYLAQKKVSYLRVHNIEANMQAIKINNLLSGYHG